MTLRPKTSGRLSGTSRSATIRAAFDTESRELLAGDKSVHVSFRTSPALLEAARRETGLDSVSELGTLALLTLAMPDPVGTVLKKTRGRLGRLHALGD